MSSVKNHHLDLNRILLIIVGLWPYQQSGLVRFQLAFLFAVLLSFIVFQLSRFTVVDCTFHFVVEILSTTLVFVLFAINYSSFWINAEIVKCLLERLEYIYEELSDENEIAILEKYGKTAKCFTKKIILISICGLFFIIFMTLSPYILDIVVPRNQSYAHRFMEIVCKHYIVQEKYFHIIVLHMNAACCVGVIAMVATDTTRVTFLKGACGLFKIASYRMKRAMAIDILSSHQNCRLRNEIVMHKEIICAVDIHCKAMEFALFLTSKFEGTIFFLALIIVGCLSLNLLRVFQIVSQTVELDELLVMNLFGASGSFVYMFLAHSMGQEITDHNNYMFSTVYNIPWYLAPLRIQKLILLLLQRKNKPFILNIGGLFTASLDCFASMASASMSYFTVMYSME